jgi:hypothetical protein
MRGDKTWQYGSERDIRTTIDGESKGTRAAERERTIFPGEEITIHYGR